MHTTTTVGLDIAKSVFQVHGSDADVMLLFAVASSSGVMF
jgi:hypothetical protein